MYQPLNDPRIDTLNRDLAQFERMSPSTTATRSRKRRKKPKVTLDTFP